MYYILCIKKFIWLSSIFYKYNSENKIRMKWIILWLSFFHAQTAAHVITNCIRSIVKICCGKIYHNNITRNCPLLLVIGCTTQGQCLLSEARTVFDMLYYQKQYRLLIVDARRKDRAFYQNLKGKF